LYTCGTRGDKGVYEEGKRTGIEYNVNRNGKIFGCDIDAVEAPKNG
jgi:hypothetical protein